MPLSKKIWNRLEREMYRKVARENEREANGAATRERVLTAMEYIMKPGQTYNNEIFIVLTEMRKRETIQKQVRHQDGGLAATLRCGTRV